MLCAPDRKTTLKSPSNGSLLQGDFEMNVAGKYYPGLVNEIILCLKQSMVEILEARVSVRARHAAAAGASDGALREAAPLSGRVLADSRPAGLGSLVCSLGRVTARLRSAGSTAFSAATPRMTARRPR